MKVQVGNRGVAPHVFNRCALNEGEWSALSSGLFILGNNSCILWSEEMFVDKTVLSDRYSNSDVSSSSCARYSKYATAVLQIIHRVFL